jgi:hypothetical protein
LEFDLVFDFHEHCNMPPTKTVQRIETHMAGVFGFFVLLNQEFAYQAAARRQHGGSATLGGCIERSGFVCGMYWRWSLPLSSSFTAFSQWFWLVVGIVFILHIDMYC